MNWKTHQNKSLFALTIGLISLSLTLSLHAEEWQPTAPIDVSQILNEAREDRHANRFDQALQKHIWFHRNAIKHQIGMYGVRLSFALSDWLELAKIYPPALEALEAEAADAEQRVLAGDINRVELFHDMISINRTLNQNAKSVALFKQVDATDPRDAKMMLHYVKQQLLNAKEYELMRKHIDPRESLRMSFISYDSLDRMIRDGSIGSLGKDHALNTLSDEAGSLVALLATLGETELAAEIMQSALKKNGSESLKKTLEAAMDGVFPTPRF